MGISNRALPALTGAPGQGGGGRVDLAGTFARWRESRVGKPTELEGPPVVDLAGNAAAARAAAEKVRQKASGANKIAPGPTVSRDTPAGRRAPGLVLNPAPGAWRLY